MLGVYGSLGGISSGPGPAAVSWSLAERGRYPNGKPDAKRIAEYFAPAVRDGAKGRFKLNLMEGNWCAAGTCFAAKQVVGSEDLEKAGLPHAYRVSGKELEEDSIKHSAWLPRADVLKGARPNAGDVAIYNRGDPQDWTRHVARVVSVNAATYECLDANGPGSSWWLTEKSFSADNLRGFIRYPASLPGISRGWGIGAGLLMIGAASALVWGVLKVKPGMLRANPGESLGGIETLKYLLGAPGTLVQIGAEHGQPVRDGIALYTSRHGSYRYVLYEGGRAIAALQAVSGNGKHAQVANVYVVPERRRQRLAAQLLQRARQDFKSVSHSDEDDLSPAGYAWSRAIKSNPLGRDCLGRGCSLDPRLVAEYRALAVAQRGAPEHAMNVVQRAAGGGVLSFVVEHVGDLTHRMSERLGYGSAGYEYVLDKVAKTMRSLGSQYGFEREHREQLESNARYYKIPLFEYKRRVDIALKHYAEAHAKLKVYNQAQWTARQAAVKLGMQEFKSALGLLRGLKHHLDKGEEYWWRYATSPPDPDIVKLGPAYLPWE